MSKTGRRIIVAIPLLCAAIHAARASHVLPMAEMVSSSGSLSDCGADPQPNETVRIGSANRLVTVYLGATDILIPFASLSGEMAAHGDGGGQAEALRAVRQAVEQSAQQAGALVQWILDRKV